jgi:hypothetical protein
MQGKKYAKKNLENASYFSLWVGKLPARRTTNHILHQFQTLLICLKHDSFLDIVF